MLKKAIYVLAVVLAGTGCYAQVRSISFGRGGEIRYDLGRGTYDVSFGGKLLLGACHARCAGVDSVLKGGYDSGEGYGVRTFTAAAFTDAMGSGMRYTVRCSGGGMPVMQQVFYVYKGKDFFCTELRLERIACNYMAPLISGHLPGAGLRVLRVPFDNDAWVRYDAMPPEGADMTSSEVTAIYDDRDKHGMVLGSVDHKDWKTGVRVNGGVAIYGGYTDEHYTRDIKGHGQVDPGSDGYCHSPRMMVGLFDDWRQGMEDYGKANKLLGGRYIDGWKKAKPFGWNSWGAMQTGLTLERAEAVVDFFHDSLRGFRNGDNTLYIDLDSYWDNLVSGGMTGDFSRLEAFCQYCQRKGFVPGIYWAPFVDWGKGERKMEAGDWRYQDCWLRAGGKYMDLDGARAMDPTHPGTQARIALLIGRFRQCGFKMIKIDFLGHAALEADSYYDKRVHTGMQAFRKGMEFLVDRIGGGMLVYAAISPNLATGRYAHMRRIACDAYSAIGETGYTLNSTTYGWWQDRIYDYIDADHVVFRDGPLGVNRARLVSALVTGTLVTGDDYSVAGPWKEAARELLQNRELLALVRSGRAFRPLEGDRGAGASNGFLREGNGQVCLAVINYSDTVMTYRVGPAAGIRAGAKEIFTGAAFPADGVIRVPPRDAMVYVPGAR